MGGRGQIEQGRSAGPSRFTRLTLGLLVGLIALSAVPEAAAWSNGAAGPNTFGTHDWVLRAAVRMAGTRANWVCRRRALRATDDPDTVDGLPYASSPWWHVYDRWNEPYGDEPAAVRFWFVQARRKLEQGRRCGASRALGIMAHLLADVAQPMHTDGYLVAEDRVHASYEHAVDERCTKSHCRYRVRDDGRDRARPARRAIALARHAHPYYRKLVRAFDAHGYNATVDAITRRQLKRAARALTDLIRRLTVTSSVREPRGRDPAVSG